MEIAKEPNEIMLIMEQIAAYIGQNVRKRDCHQCFQPVGQPASCKDLKWRIGYAGGPVFWFFEITAHGGSVWTASYKGTDFAGFLRAVLADLKTGNWQKKRFAYLD
ncbi:MAG TPA: hypothetical protein P5080_00190 [Candidatus Paceibacterota bacterium]|nr:hypothetical protein [Candidatus Pacearchaeota archaeon]HRZ50393.1 hypothetical protein [Candidatus Paceibacterota bacterium]HSA36114.1 hypothetical protein [Candidatus Paceibacterota bacterium]